MNLRPWLIVLVLSALACACSHYRLVEQPPPARNGYVIRDVDVFTAVPESPVLRGMDVYVHGDAIAEISPRRLDIPGAEVIDGHGRMLLPGLVDFHTHITSSMLIPWKRVIPTMEFNLEGCLYGGVTTVMDMSGMPPEKMASLAGDLQTGEITGPRLFHCGMGFTGKGAHPIPMMEKIKETFPWIVRPFIPEIVIQVNDPADMERLEEHLAAQPDFTKIFLDDLPDGTPKMQPAIVAEIVRRSHEKGIPVIIHIGRNEDVRVAVDSGADGIAHNVYKGPLDPALARELAARRMFVIPTVYVFHNLNLFMNERDFRHYYPIEWETMEPSARKELENPRPYIVPDGDIWGDYYRHFRESYHQVFHPNVKVLKDAGVTIIAGTDSPNLGIASGGSLHAELIHLVQGGLSPTEALLCATSTPARVLREVFHKDVRFGSIEKGNAADLLLVDGDPTNSISDTQNIVTVFCRGVRIERLE